LTLGMENIHLVRVPRRDPQLGLQRIEVDGALKGLVQTADVEGELAVHEDPEVVITPEREELSLLVRELHVDFSREVVVVILAGRVSEPLAVEGEERVAIVHVGAGSRRVLHELQRVLDGHAPRRVVVPLVEGRSVLDLVSRRSERPWLEEADIEDAAGGGETPRASDSPTLITHDAGWHRHPAI